MEREAALFWRWLGAVVIRFWGWIGAVSTAIFLLDYVPDLQPSIDCLVGRNNRWWFLIGGLVALLFSSFLAWRAGEKALGIYTHPSLALEFSPPTSGFLELVLNPKRALYIRVLPVTSSRVDGCIGYLEGIFRLVNGEWIPVGYTDRRPLHWSTVHERGVTEVARLKDSPQFLDVAFINQGQNTIYPAVDQVPLIAGDIFVQYPRDFFKFVIRVVGNLNANAVLALQIQQTDQWDRPNIRKLS